MIVQSIMVVHPKKISQRNLKILIKKEITQLTDLERRKTEAFQLPS
jgi:hypothetical protein